MTPMNVVPSSNAIPRSYLRISVRGTPFTLSKRQIEFDTPSLFSNIFDQVNPADPDEVLELDTHPDLFAIIQDYLSGYQVLPLNERAVPRTMSIDQATQNLARDADFLQLAGLQNLLAADQKAYLQTVSSINKLKRMKTISYLLETGLGSHMDDEWLYSTLFVANNVVARPHDFECIHEDGHEDGVESRSTYGFALPDSFWEILKSVGSKLLHNVSWYYSKDARIEINGVIVSRIAWTALQKCFGTFGTQYSYLDATSLSQAAPALQALKLEFSKVFNEDYLPRETEDLEPSPFTAIAREVRFTITPSDFTLPVTTDTSHIMWVHSLKLTTAPELAKSSSVIPSVELPVSQP